MLGELGAEFGAELEAELGMDPGSLLSDPVQHANTGHTMQNIMATKVQERHSEGCVHKVR